MSTFLRTLDAYCDRFGVTPRDRRRIMLRYPLFKVAWWSEYGRGPLRGAARAAYALGKAHRMDHEVDAADGSRLRVPLSFASSDLASFREIFWGGEYEAPFDLSRARTLVDLGANTGMAALYFLTQAPLERLLLVEANPALLPDLRRTFGDRAAIEHACVLGTPGSDEVRFYVSVNHRHGSAMTVDAPTEAGHEIHVPATTLSALLDAHGIDEVAILKIDIEGAEHDVIENDPGGVARARILLAEVQGDAERRDGFVQRLEALAFRVARRVVTPDGRGETLAAAR